MKTDKLNEEWFDHHAHAQFQWKESVEHVAPALHSKAQQIAKRGAACLEVLDLGAGETGLSTYPYLATGCTVYAVDASSKALHWLREGARSLPGTLVPCHQESESFVEEAIQNGRTFDVVVARSFLHHIPDYLGMLKETAKVIAPKGAFLSYEDPPPYDRMSRFDTFYSRSSYYTLRLFCGNYVRGLKTLWRRLTGKIDERLPEDMIEYHIVRNGVDDEKIKQLFEELGLCCEVTKYFTTSNVLTRHLGRVLNVKNSFAVLAYRE